MGTPEIMKELDAQLQYLFNLSVSATLDYIKCKISEEYRHKILAEYDLKAKECIKNAFSLAISSHNKELVENMKDFSVGSWLEHDYGADGQEDFDLAEALQSRFINLIKDSK